MSDTRQVFETTLGNQDTQYRIVIPGYGCPKGGDHNWVALVNILKEISNNPWLLNQAGETPQTIKISYQGGRWVCESIVIKNNHVII